MRLPILPLLGFLASAPLAAQQPGSDSLATVRVVATHEEQPVEAATVRSGTVGALTGADGAAVVRLSAGVRRIVVARIGFAPETLFVLLRAAQDTTLRVSLGADEHEVERVIVSATRSERRIEDEPLRVEVLGREEIEEKLLMTPGDIAMLLNETAGLRVQTTSPSLGGASVRVQGLRGRYTQVLSDGLPLHGGQTGALGLLQIPPMDLGQVEVIKGAASALYGAGALGGVVNLVSRRPAEEHERELLLNVTSRGGRDGIFWGSGPLGERSGYTILAGAHGQAMHDADGDGWADLPGYRRAVVRPRYFARSEAGHSLLLTAGATAEEREGGTLRGRTAPDGVPFEESLDTRRGDVGGVARMLVGRNFVTVRGSGTVQRHEHRFGAVRERDRHGTWFVEAALGVPRERAGVIAGAAVQRERYAAADVAGFDHAHTTPAVFAQADASPASWLSLTASARADFHREYGTSVDPRLSVLVRAPEALRLPGWTVRTSVGTGTFTPSPFTEETEVTGLAPLLPLGDLRAERAVTGSVDVGGPVGAVEVNVTAFASRVRDPLVAERPQEMPDRLRLVNAAGPTRTAGGELLARYAREPWHLTATYTFVRSTEHSPETGARRETPNVPRHAAGFVGAFEMEGRGRIGLELYYTGRQALEENPYRTESAPYLIVGALAERRIGPARVFLNLENLGDVRQTRWDPLLLPERGRGGRWTTDAWTELAGRTINGGVRLEF